jgi:long-chain fatty acid transport protein
VLKKLQLLGIAMILSASQIFASGFQINEHGARAMAMGGAFTALASDPSAIYFNPAGLTQLKGTQFMGGATLIQPSSSFRGPAPAITEYELKEQLFTPFNFYITHQFSDNITAGIGVNNPYGLGTKWDEDWVGRFLAIETEIRSFFFTPAVAYKINDQLSVSIGGVISYADVLISRKIQSPQLALFDSEARIDLEGDATAFGFTAGVQYKPNEMFSFGLSYRSQVEHEFTGTADVTTAQQLQASVPQGDVTAPLTTPRNITFGAAAHVMENLTIAADFQYVGWSSYDKLEITFEDTGDKSVNQRDYDNSFIARLGGEYKLSNDFDLRGGVFYDKNPVKDEKLDPTLPDADRIGLNIGFGYDLTDNLTVDVAYLFLRFNERTVTNSDETYAPAGFAPFNGTYNSTANLFGLNFSYKL